MNSTLISVIPSLTTARYLSVFPVPAVRIGGGLSYLLGLRYGKKHKAGDVSENETRSFHRTEHIDEIWRPR